MTFRSYCPEVIKPILRPLFRRKPKTTRYHLAVDRAYNEAIEMALYYVMSADVRGNIAEFGTHGDTAQVIAEFLSQHPRVKANLYLFDSFQGFPAPTARPDLECPHVLSGAWAKGTSRGNRTAADIAKIVGKWIPPDRFRIYGGWYEETLRQIAPMTQFSILLMDCCFYASHYHVLSHLFSNRLVSKGAMILFSDWSANRGSPDFGSRLAWSHVKRRFSIQSSDEGSYCWGGHKFIIHDYF